MKESTNDPQTKALLWGMNFRVDLGHAFKAAWTAAELYLGFQQASAAGHITPLEFMHVAVESFELIVSTLDAVREKITATNYAACMYLSGRNDGVRQDEFQAGFLKFLEESLQKGLPWYVGLSKKSIQQALDTMRATNAADRLLQSLAKDEWFEEADGKIKFKPRHVSWTLR